MRVSGIEHMLCFVQVVAHIILDCILAGVFTALSGMFVIPTLASDAVRRDIGRVVVGLGHSLSGFALSHTHFVVVISDILWGCRGAKSRPFAVCPLPYSFCHCYERSSCGLVVG